MYSVIIARKDSGEVWVLELFLRFRGGGVIVVLTDREMKVSHF